MKIRVSISRDDAVDHDGVTSFLPDEHGNLKVFADGDLIAVHADCTWQYAFVAPVDPSQPELPIEVQ